MCNVLNDLVPIVAILAVFGTPAAVIIVIAVLRYRQKIMLINRGCAPMIDFSAPYGQAPLLWGTVLTAVSVVGLVIGYVRYDTDFTALAALALAAGLALLAYWFVSAPQRRRERDLYERTATAKGVFCPIIPTGAPLLWGMILTAVSAVGIVISLVRYEYDWTNAAFLTLTAGVTLLAYWVITIPQRRRALALFEQKCGEAR
jgi:hypothetical protein